MTEQENKRRELQAAYDEGYQAGLDARGWTECNDLISRSEILGKAVWYNLYGGYRSIYAVSAKEIEETPPVSLNAPRWISVEDERKPKYYEECLCVYRFPFGDHKREISILRWHPMDDNGYIRKPHFRCEGLGVLNVTHWMPLPKLPEE